MSTAETTLELILTDSAVAKVTELLREQDIPAAESHLRLFVSGGGCGGPSFGLAFDKFEDGDAQIALAGLTVLVDPVTLPYVRGATIDFIQTPEVTGFKVTAPALLEMMGGCSSGSCGSEASSGCGSGGGGGGCGSHSHDHAGHDHAGHSHGGGGGGGCGSGGGGCGCSH